MPRATLILMLLFVATPGRAATVHVPGDQPTIQAGIDATAPGDTVEVACGTYFEHDIVMKSGITLRSASESSDCATIDAGGLGRVVVGDLLEPSTTIAGFTMTGGVATGPWPKIYGGGLDLTVSLGHIHDCFFVGNLAEWGGGIAMRNQSSPLVEDCRSTYPSGQPM